jgi:glycerophosphoryl diester phosphodiesterase
MGLTRILGHRGAAQEHPENTLAAFADARRLGADGVELDVRRSLDGGLVVAHDPVLPGLGPIAKLRVAEVPAEVPLLDAALEACAGLYVNVELKFDQGEDLEAAEAFAAAVLDCSLEVMDREELLFSSFAPQVLSALRRLDSEILLGLLLDYVQDPADFIESAVASGFDALNPFVLTLTDATIERCTTAGLGLNLWTVNGAEDLARLFAAGVDSVITDDVALAVRVRAEGASG